MILEKKHLNEWERAKGFLLASKNNLKIGDIKTAANREYFSVERAIVCTLILEKKKVPKNHKNIWEMSKFLDLDINIYKLMRELYDLRLQADYGKISDLVELTNETVLNYIEKIDLLIKKIKEKYNLK